MMFRVCLLLSAVAAGTDWMMGGWCWLLSVAAALAEEVEASSCFGKRKQFIFGWGRTIYSYCLTCVCV